MGRHPPSCGGDGTDTYLSTIPNSARHGRAEGMRAQMANGWAWPIDENGEAIGAPVELHDVVMPRVTYASQQRIEGVHADEILYVMDEAKTVPLDGGRIMEVYTPLDDRMRDWFRACTSEHEWKERVWGMCFDAPPEAADVSCAPIPCPGESIPCPDFEPVTVECTGPLCWTCHALLDADGRCAEHG